jgi:hypothetical protein
MKARFVLRGMEKSTRYEVRDEALCVGKTSIFDHKRHLYGDESNVGHIHVDIYHATTDTEKHTRHARYIDLFLDIDIYIDRLCIGHHCYLSIYIYIYILFVSGWSS